MIDYGRPELVYRKASLLGEGPVWNRELQVLFWLDSFSNQINIFNPAGNTNKIIEMPEVVGSLGFAESKRSSFLQLIVAMQSGFYLLRLETSGLHDPETLIVKRGMMQFLDNPEKHISGNRFNDGKSDSAGRFWAGTMSRALDSGAGDLTPRGNLYSLTLKASNPGSISSEVRLKQDKVIISNGIAFSPDNTHMYYNDTPTRQISCFDFNAVTGEISNRRSVFDMPEGWGNPDGMCIDTEGFLWVALWDGFRVIRVNPENSTAVGEIMIPDVRNVTSCCFGGRSLNELYITTSCNGIDCDSVSDPKSAGSLFRIALPVCGAAVPPVKVITINE